VARIFNTYGPGMYPNDARVISNFIVQGQRGEAVTVYGDGKQTRSLCYVDDKIQGIIRLMNSPQDVRGPVNLGKPAECSILELAGKIVELTNSRSEIRFAPLPADDTRQRQPDITLARQLLNREPVTPQEEGLLRTIEYFDTLLSAGRGVPASDKDDKGQSGGSSQRRFVTCQKRSRVGVLRLDDH
jgi:UDP-glucuronate decarboxylase